MASAIGDIKASREAFYNSFYLKRGNGYEFEKIYEFDRSMRDFMFKMSALLKNQEALKKDPSLSKDQLLENGVCAYSLMTGTFDTYQEGSYSSERIEKILHSRCCDELSRYTDAKSMSTFIVAKLKTPESWEKFIGKVQSGQMKSSEEKANKNTPASKPAQSMIEAESPIDKWYKEKQREKDASVEFRKLLGGEE